MKDHIKYHYFPLLQLPSLLLLLLMYIPWEMPYATSLTRDPETGSLLLSFYFSITNYFIAFYFPGKDTVVLFSPPWSASLKEILALGEGFSSEELFNYRFLIGYSYALYGVFSLNFIMRLVLIGVLRKERKKGNKNLSSFLINIEKGILISDMVKGMFVLIFLVFLFFMGLFPYVKFSLLSSSLATPHTQAYKIGLGPSFVLAILVSIWDVYQIIEYKTIEREESQSAFVEESQNREDPRSSSLSRSSLSSPRLSSSSLSRSHNIGRSRTTLQNRSLQEMKQRKPQWDFLFLSLGMVFLYPLYSIGVLKFYWFEVMPFQFYNWGIIFSLQNPNFNESPLNPYILDFYGSSLLTTPYIISDCLLYFLASLFMFGASFPYIRYTLVKKRMKISLFFMGCLLISHFLFLFFVSFNSGLRVGPYFFIYCGIFIATLVRYRTLFIKTQ